MIRGKKHIILTDIQCAANIQFYEDDYGDNTAVVDFTFVNMEDNIIIPKRFYVLTDECVEQYYLFEVTQLNSLSGSIEYYVESFYDLTDEGKEQYKLLRENEEKRTHRSSVEHGKDYYPANVKVYNWFLKLISDLDNVHHGNRYRCMYALAVYGVKCGISPEVVKEDLLLLLPKYNEIKSNHYDAKYMLDIKDVENALSAYKQAQLLSYSDKYLEQYLS